MRSRIPLTRLLLKTVIDATKSHPSVYFWALLGTVIQAFFSIWTAWTLVSVYQRFSPSGAASSTGGNTGSGAVTGLIVFIGVAYYWTSELIKAVFFTTIAGTFGAWYYALPGDKARGASIKSFGRAISLSLGSLAFGSLIIALLDLLRAVLSIVQSSEAAGGDMVGAAIACVANCLLGCVQWAVELFNKYAYINIALYGNSYIKAAKETWRLVKDRGIDAIAQDCLTGIVFSFGSVIVGVITWVQALGSVLYPLLTLSLARPHYTTQRHLRLRLPQAHGPDVHQRSELLHLRHPPRRRRHGYPDLPFPRRRRHQLGHEHAVRRLGRGPIHSSAEGE